MALTKKSFADQIRDIGAGGLFISTDGKVAVGQPVSLKLPLVYFDNPIHTTESAVCRDKDGAAVTFNEAIEGLICKEDHFPEIVLVGDR